MLQKTNQGGVAAAPEETFRGGCDHVAKSGIGWTYCFACGSRAIRVDGMIEEFTRGNLDAPKPPLPSHEAAAGMR